VSTEGRVLFPQVFKPSPMCNVFPDRSRRRWIAALCLLCVLVITQQAWIHRFGMNPDGISYLDIADGLLQGDLRRLVHPYWSPLYPCLQAAVLKVLSPTPDFEFPVVHLTNWLIGLGTVASFTFFLCRWLRLRGAGQPVTPSLADFRVRTSFAYALFLWSTLQMVGLNLVTPDLCVAALVYLAAGLCCRMAVCPPKWGASVLLGMVLGSAYLAKTAMLPLCAVLLGILALPWSPLSSRRSSLAIAALTLGVTVAPFVIGLSRQQHRLTFGESGRLNYAWLVQGGIPVYAGWAGQTLALGTPAHPPRILSHKPAVLEFKDTVPGTYPPWYDPAFFHEGLQVRFDLRKQIIALGRSPRDFISAGGDSLIPLMAGACVLCFLSPRGWRRAVVPNSWLLLWPLAGFAMYALVRIEARYIAAFLVLFSLAIYDTASPGRLRLAQSAVVTIVALCVCLFQLKTTLKDTLVVSAASKPFTDIVVSRELARLGLRPGDEIAVVGDLAGFGAYYARLSRLKIVAEVPDARQFLLLGYGESSALEENLRRVGARAIVGRVDCTLTGRVEWQPIADSGYCVRLLK